MKFFKLIITILLFYMLYQIIMFSQSMWLQIVACFVFGFMLIAFAMPNGTRIGWLVAKPQQRFQKFTTSDKNKNIVKLMVFVYVLSIIVLTWIIPVGNNRTMFIAFALGMLASNLVGYIYDRIQYKKTINLK